ncbi:MAG: bifunctional nuclease family protein [Bacillota bacterium]
MIPVKVKEIAFDLAMNPVLLLSDEEEHKMLPIWIGPFEAHSIALALEGASLGRPLTHDLLKTICDQSGVTVASVIISDVKDGTYYAELHLRTKDYETVIDARPSDAIALALRTVTPIFLSDKVADYALTPDELYSQESEESKIVRVTDERKLH